MKFIEAAYIIIGIGTLERIPDQFTCANNLNQDPGHQYGVDEVMIFFQDLSKFERILFLKGFVLCEKYFNWQTGSVPTTPYLLRYIIHKDTYCNQYKEDLYNWIFKNRGDNDYSPTGFQKHGKHSCNSYKDKVRIDSLTSYNVNPNRERIRARRDRKSYIKKLKHTLRALEKDQYEDRVREKIERFNFFSDWEKVEVIKKDRLDFPITLLPEKTIDLFIEHVNFINNFQKSRFLDSLPKRTNKELTRRIKKGLDHQL
jgi:hypothetical protein